MVIRGSAHAATTRGTSRLPSQHNRRTHGKRSSSWSTRTSINVAASALVALTSSHVWAEGSAQLGLTQRPFDFDGSLAQGLATDTNSASYFLDILAAGEVINISVCGADDDDEIGIEIFAPGGGSVFVEELDEPNLDCEDPMTGPLTTPVRYTTIVTGAYRIELQNLRDDNDKDSIFERFDISVTPDALTNPDPTVTAGRLWAYSWNVNADSYNESESTDADLYSLVPGGSPGTNYIWKVDLNNFAGETYNIVANDIGVDAPNSGLSVPTAGNSVAHKYPLYLSVPAIAGGQPFATPMITNFQFVDDDGDDNSISPGATPGVQDSGTFGFNSDVVASYTLLVDTGQDGSFNDTEDLIAAGSTVVGANQVVWDGRNANGELLPFGDFNAQIVLRLGEFHFIANDVETSGGPSANGLTIFRSDGAGVLSNTQVFWDDATVLGGTTSLPGGGLSGTAAGSHTWGNFSSGGFGSGRYIDTYVFGESASASTAVEISSIDAPPPDSDGDGTPDEVEGFVADSDGDGIPNYLESSIEDADGDGVNNEADPANLNACIPSQFATGCATDSDGDGASDSAEGQFADSDGDGAPNYLESSIIDSDGDGLSDQADPANLNVCIPSQFAPGCGIDSDGDGTPDSVEGQFPDSDGDGTPNYLESSTADSDGDGVNDQLDPANLNACVPSQFAAGCTIDTDGDGTPDSVEGQFTDSDGDGTPNYLESSIADADGDGVNDQDDRRNDNSCVPSQFGAGCATDTDSDGTPDSDEGEFTDTDGDGTPDYLESSAADSDGDGVNDQNDADDLDACVPSQFGTGCTTDTDGDGTPDSVEGEFTDSDGDGAPNYQESSLTDTDGDGVSDEDDAENLDSCTPSQFGTGCTTDTDGDGTPDSVEGEFTDSDGDGTPDYLESSVADADGDGTDDQADPADADACAPSQFGTGCTTDTDGDGTPDSAEGEVADGDGDGTPDYLESSLTDNDGDGFSDQADPADLDACVPSNFGLGCATDTDGDGTPDSAEGRFTDSDGDGTPDYLESSAADSDGDGVSDQQDSSNADACTPLTTANGCTADTDGDGITDPVEAAIGTDHLNPDSDGDGLSDGDELNGTGPLAGIGTTDPLDADTDDGGSEDGEEVLVDGTNPTVGNGADDLLLDSDGDGIADLFEGTGVDSDFDGRPDYLDRDSDGDGIPDSLETRTDTDGDGIPNYVDLDSDGDGIPDAAEENVAVGFDIDGDGIDDGYDVDSSIFGVDANGDGVDDAFSPPDADNDGKPDFLDIDSDNDGIPDVVEADMQIISDHDGDQISDTYDADATMGPDVNGDGVDDTVVSTDTDGDGVPDYLDLDTDNDALPDVTEAGGPDANSDALIDDPEVNEGGIVVPPDTDRDGVGDWRDLDSNNDGMNDIAGTRFAGLDADGDGAIDDSTDVDGDGLADVFDQGEGFGAAPDTDRDTILDKTEGAEDMDADGLPNFIDTDSDNDGIDDIVEVGSDPSNPVDTDGDGLPDFVDTDSDGDGIADSLEGLNDFNQNQTPDFLEPESQLGTATRGVVGGGGGGGSASIWLLLMLAVQVLARYRRALATAVPAIVLASAAALAPVGKSFADSLCGQFLDPQDFTQFYEGDDYQRDRAGYRGCWYGNLGAGVSSLTPEQQGSNFFADTGADTGGAGHLLLGRQLSPRWFAELKFADLGEAAITSRNPAVAAAFPDAAISYDVTSLMLGYHWRPDRNFKPFVRAGVAGISNEATGGPIPFEKESSAQIAAGAGVKVDFGRSPWYVAASVDWYDRDAQYAVFSVGRFFGHRAEPRSALIGASGSSGPSGAVGPAFPGEYRLAVGDRVRVAVFNQQDLSGEHDIDGEGRLSLPLIGAVAALGLTTTEIELAIAAELIEGGYLLDPQVNVEILNFRPIYVLGEVAQPGSYPYASGMTVAAAVAVAGGYSYRARETEITIRRTDNEGNEQTLTGGPSTPVRPGDIIEIPERFF